MPSFDIVSEQSLMVIQNVLANLERELKSRWDFRNERFEIEHQKASNAIELTSSSEMHLHQMLDVLRHHMAKQEMAQQSIEVPENFTHSGKDYRLRIELKEGIPKPLAKSLTQSIKSNFPKLQAQIQGEKITVQSKSKDHLQSVIEYLKSETWERPLQFKNFKD